MAFRPDPVFEHLIPYFDILTARPRIIEVGMHWGESTKWLKAICQQPPYYWGFEPDPRNISVLDDAGERPWSYAVSDRAEEVTLYMSGGVTPGTGNREHTDSSSICVPTTHLQVHPWCTFEDKVVVQAVTLDDFFSGVKTPFDLIWADVQGAQRKLIAGAKAVLRNTALLYIEVHPEPMYEGEPTFEELCELLPEFRVRERYEADVLFENSRAVRERFAWNQIAAEAWERPPV